MKRAFTLPEFPIGLRVMLPLLASLLIAVAPRAIGIDQLLLGSSFAQDIGLPTNAAAQQMSLLHWEAWRVDLWQPTGRLAFSGGDLDSAAANLELAQEIGSLDVHGQQLLGEVYWQRQEKEKALAEWKPLIQQGWISTDVYQRVVQYRRSLGNLAEADWYAQLWQQFFPEDWRASWNGGLLILPVDWTKAGEKLTLAAKLEPSQSVSAQALLQVLSQDGPPVPEEVRLVQIGRVLGGLGEWDLALAAFEGAKKVNPLFADAWAFAGEAKQQLHQDGQGDLAQAIQLAPDSAAIQAMAGLNARRRGEMEAALTRFTRAAELEPQRAIWQMEIGNSYADLHNLQKGLSYYQTAVNLDPNDSAGWRLMAQFCLSHEFSIRETGLPAARQAAALAGDNAANLDVIGQTVLAVGDETSAERFLQQAIQKSGIFPEAYFHLGTMYLRQEKMDWAEYYLALAVRMSEKSPEVGTMAQRLLVRYFSGR